MKYLLSIAFCIQFALSLFAQIKPVNLKCEYLTNPEGIDMPDPRFYWQLKSEESAPGVYSMQGQPRAASFWEPLPMVQNM